MHRDRPKVAEAVGILAVLALSCAATGPEHGQQVEPPNGCVGNAVVAPRRVVRLSEHQIWNAYAALFGGQAAAIITKSEALPSDNEREFPPVGADVTIGETLFGKIDRLAQAAMTYVSENADNVTPCGARPSDKSCVQTYLLSLAERAYRHPLTIAEQTAITGEFWAEMAAVGADLPEALAYGVYGVLSSASFVYRTEFGADGGNGTETVLAPYELASELSFFLADQPPDDQLLAAAAADALGTPDQVRVQAERLLARPEVRANLESAVVRYFGLSRAPAVVLNPEATPGLIVTTGLELSIFHEGELFLKNTLWAGPLGDLLTSRRTWTSAPVATGVYGVAPPAEVDSDGFGAADLADDRAGLFTLSTFLLAGARSTGGSPVARGLAVNASVVCDINPPFPATDPEVAAAISGLASSSELEKARYRAANAKCAACHGKFDAFGMVLEPYDAVGRLRQVDSAGRPIDAAWTTTVLPASVGSTAVAGAVETARALVTSGALDRCMTMNFLNYALAEITRGGANNTELARASQTGSCAVQRVVEGLRATEATFPALMREIAASSTFTRRSRGL